jgi:hypothetical protein
LVIPNLNLDLDLDSPKIPGHESTSNKCKSEARHIKTFFNDRPILSLRILRMLCPIHEKDGTGSSLKSQFDRKGFKLTCHVDKGRGL